MLLDRILDVSIYFVYFSYDHDVSGGAMWGLWGDYGTCSKTCGTGQQTRSRPCRDVDGGEACVGNSTDTRDCNTIPCEGELNLSNEQAQHRAAKDKRPFNT